MPPIKTKKTAIKNTVPISDSTVALTPVTLGVWAADISKKAVSMKLPNNISDNTPRTTKRIICFGSILRPH